MRDAVWRAACLSCLGAALVMAPPGPAMRHAEDRAAPSSLRAALVLAPPAASMRGAVKRAACNSSDGAAPAVRAAVLRATAKRVLGAAALFTLPLAPSLLRGIPPPKPQPLRRAIYSRHPLPLSPQRSASAHDGGSARAGQTLGSACLIKMVKRGNVRCSRQDGQGLLRTLHRQVRRLLARRAASPNPDGRFDTPHRYTGSTARRRDTLEVPAVLGGSALRGVRESLRRCESKPEPPCAVQVAVTAVHGEPPHRLTCRPGHITAAPGRQTLRGSRHHLLLRVSCSLE
jgi:hypothetical protein